MTSRWRFITSSYFSTFLRISKLRASTWLCALWIARLTILDSSGTSSGIPARDSRFSAMPELNSRIRSSVSER